jgi:hypothetical protein
MLTNTEHTECCSAFLRYCRRGNLQIISNHQVDNGIQRLLSEYKSELVNQWLTDSCNAWRLAVNHGNEDARCQKECWWRELSQHRRIDCLVKQSASFFVDLNTFINNIALTEFLELCLASNHSLDHNKVVFGPCLNASTANAAWNTINKKTLAERSRVGSMMYS